MIRAELLSGPRTFLLVIAAVLIPLGAFLALTGPPEARAVPGAESWRGRGRVTGLAGAVGIVGGIYGIGGGAIIGPLLVAMRYSPFEVVPAALTSTFATSVVGVATFTVLDLLSSGDSIAPEWGLGAVLGLGGVMGAYIGASLQHRVPERLLRRGLGALAVGLGCSYLVAVAL